MHMMFVDESGDTGYPASGRWQGWGGTRVFVRVGVIIHGWKWKAWNQRLLTYRGEHVFRQVTHFKYDSDCRRMYKCLLPGNRQREW